MSAEFQPPVTPKVPPGVSERTGRVASRAKGASESFQVRERGGVGSSLRARSRVSVGQLGGPRPHKCERDRGCALDVQHTLGPRRLLQTVVRILFTVLFGCANLDSIRGENLHLHPPGIFVRSNVVRPKFPRQAIP